MVHPIGRGVMLFSNSKEMKKDGERERERETLTKTKSEGQR
jgi:hypothetical protein